MAIPNAFCCPITYDIMIDPVTDCFGHTYERKAIEQWYLNNSKSPNTNLQVTNKNLVPNYAIKQLIADYLEQEKKKQVIQQVTQSSPMLNPKSPVLLPSVIDTRKIEMNQYIINDLNTGKKYLNLNFNAVNTDRASTRKPVKVICIIDVSGSMGELAKEHKVGEEFDGLTRLDLVKHSLNTIHQSLNANDSIALISFNERSNITLNITDIIPQNNDKIKLAINSLKADGLTYIWDGLRNGLIMATDLYKKFGNTHNISIILLTDGESNYVPPRGILPTFNDEIKRQNININNGFLPFAINTFAYGYSVNSCNLKYFAEQTNGIFGFIPDGTMVGTVLINAMSNILSTAIFNQTVSIQSNYQLKYRNEVLNTTEQQCKTFSIGNIPYGHSRNILLEIGNCLNLQTICGAYSDVDFEGIISVNDTVFPITNTLSLDNESNLNKLALLNAIFVIKSIVDNHDCLVNLKLIESFTDFLKSKYLSAPSNFIRDLIDDFSNSNPNFGQIRKAIERQEWYNKWGKHYLRSVLCAYEMEICLNFKDLTPKHFSSSLFLEYQSQIEDVFSKIELPPPSHKTYVFQTKYSSQHNSFGSGSVSGNSGSGSLSVTYSQTQTRQLPTSYYNVDGGCFTGQWKVNMPNGVIKNVSDIKPGDVVVSKDSPTGVAIVRVILKLQINRCMDMISLNNGAGITHYHPYYMDDTKHNWKYPTTSTEAIYGATPGEYMYDFILDCGHTVNMVGGFNIVCLGHGFTHSPVIKHEYFGTNRVIDDLKDHPDWSNGIITLDNWEFIRDKSSNRIIQLKY